MVKDLTTTTLPTLHRWFSKTLRLVHCHSGNRKYYYYYSLCSVIIMHLSWNTSNHKRRNFHTTGQHQHIYYFLYFLQKRVKNENKKEGDMISEGCDQKTQNSDETWMFTIVNHRGERERKRETDRVMDYNEARKEKMQGCRDKEKRRKEKRTSSRLKAIMSDMSSLCNMEIYICSTYDLHHDTISTLTFLTPISPLLAAFKSTYISQLGWRHLSKEFIYS